MGCRCGDIAQLNRRIASLRAAISYSQQLEAAQETLTTRLYSLSGVTEAVCGAYPSISASQLLSPSLSHRCFELQGEITSALNALQGLLASYRSEDLRHHRCLES